MPSTAVEPRPALAQSPVPWSSPTRGEGPVPRESQARGESTARAVLDSVVDPEIPVLTIADLGILRAVEVRDDGHVVVTITPTYSGCPAMETISDDILIALARAGFAAASVRTELSPAWTTDWMSEDGRRKLVEYGIAPPSGQAPRRSGAVSVGISVRCPQCGSPETREVSRFGSTACKAQWQCSACLEPFDHFKTI